MNILFTICGRAGSKGFKNKNLKILNGVPLVYYTLAAISLYKDVHPEHNIQIAVNTDSEDLIQIIKNQTKLTNIKYIERNDNLAGDLVPKVDVIRDTFLKSDDLNTIDIVVDLDITSPMRRLCDVENVINKLVEEESYDLVFSVVPARRSPYFNMVEKRGIYYNKVCSSNFTARQQAPCVYELNASIYAYRSCFLKKNIEKTLLDYNCGIIEMPDYFVLDIDSEVDFIMMEEMFKLFSKRDERLNKVVIYALECMN